MSIPIGQGLSVTPIQLVMAGNAIANGGELLSPMIVNKIKSPAGNTVLESKIENKYPVISPGISAKLLSYLQHVVTPGGTGYLASIPDFPIAGKTSTAMKSDKTGYSTNKFQASFIGFFPGDHPEISIFIWYDEPGGGAHQGGQIAAPIFRDVLTDILPMVHKGKLRETNPLEEKKIFLRNYNKNIMPDLRHKSKKEAMFIVWSLFPGEHIIEGKGYLTHQDPPPGRRIKEPFQFSLTFEEK
jgi:membrane peptidoglycan carboxypeptidase